MTIEVYSYRKGFKVFVRGEANLREWTEKLKQDGATGAECEGNMRNPKEQTSMRYVNAA